jgi:hypothetical protein
MAVVEVRPGRKQLDFLEAVSGDVNQMVPGQALAVEEVGRDPESPCGHDSSYPPSLLRSYGGQAARCYAATAGKPRAARPTFVTFVSFVPASGDKSAAWQ